MTEREQEVLELAIEWRRSKFAVAEALVRQKMVHAIDMLMKERRDAASKSASDKEAEDSARHAKAR